MVGGGGGLTAELFRLFPLYLRVIIFLGTEFVSLAAVKMEPVTSHHIRTEKGLALVR